MAYGRRDWDQQDRRWHNDNGRGQVRRREDEEGGDWDGYKRRRYDEYDDQGYNNRDDRGSGGGGQRRNDHDDWRSGRQADQDNWKTRHDPMEEDDQYHHGHHSKGKRIVASEPSEHVIFLGLDTDFLESDLLTFIQSYDLTPAGVTIIRDRNTGLSKGFGFIQFNSVSDAQTFVEPNFPFISVPPPRSHGAQAAQAYAEGNYQVGRRAKIDYSQSAGASRYGSGGGGRNANDGTRDLGNAPSPVVLLRGIDPISGLDAISDALRASSGPGVVGAKNMKRIVLIKDKYTALGIGLAFVELIDTESAGLLLGALMSAELHPEGFRIGNKPIASSFASTHSFIPLAPHQLRDEGCIMGSQAMGGTTGVFAKYWDEATVVTEKTFEVAEPVKKEVAQGTKEKKKKKKEKEQDALIDLEISAVFEQASAKIEAAGSVLPTGLKPLTLSLGKGGLSAKGPAPKVTPTTNTLSTAFTSADANEPEEIPDNKPLDKAMTFRKVAPMVASKKVANKITQWNQVSQELRQPNAAQAAPQPLPLSLMAIPSNQASQAQTTKVPQALKTPPADDLSEFCNVQASTCFLCGRKLQSAEQLGRHVKESDLHKKNLADETLKETARKKAANARAKQQQQESSATKTVYRDRASERRVMHGQPDVPLPEPSTSSSTQKHHHSTPLPPPKAPTPPPLEPAKDENNIGNKLLKKMGWNAGTGLGLTGDGRVDPVQTAIYAQGVGLGASKGKEVTQYAGLDYAGLAKESARERYNQQ